MTERACERIVIRVDDPLERMWLLRLCLGRHWVCCVLGLCSFGRRTKRIREVIFSPLFMPKRPTQQPRALAIILRALALGAGIYRGISPVRYLYTQHVSLAGNSKDRPLTARIRTYVWIHSKIEKAFIHMGPLMHPCTINIFFNFIISIAFALHSMAA